MLTKRQYELLSFLVTYQKEYGVSPSYEEMGEALSLRSKSSVHGLVSGLEKRGYCKRLSNKARAIDILKTPDEEVSALKALPSLEAGVSVPFFGELPSTLQGKSLESRGHKTYGDLPPSSAPLMAFHIVGDYLKEWGVLNGDEVVLEETTAFTNGALVLVSCGDRHMLRRCMDEGPRVTIKTANKHMIPESYEKSQIEIRAKLLFLRRQYG